MLKEKHELPSIIHEFLSSFFSSFCECLGTFLASLYAKFFLSFYSFSEAKRFFIISPHSAHGRHLKRTRYIASLLIAPPFFYGYRLNS